MKNTFKIMMALASVAAAFISCSKEVATPEVIEQDEIQVSIQAGSPVTKTMISGSTPYWCDGDAIGVSNQTKDNNKQFNENSIGAGLTAETATFSGSVAATGTYYAYYPFTSNGVSASGAKVDIPSTQHPTLTSFDGTADVMVSKSFTIETTSATTIENLEFARLGAIVKVVLIDNAASYDLSAEQPNSVSITAPENIVGRVYVDMANQELGELYYNQSKTVTAEYPSAKFAINGTNGAYFVVYPQTLAAGETLTVSASTEHYDISKDCTIPAGGIVLEGGSVTVLNISLADGNISATTAGAALPFDDDMTWADNGGSDDGTDLVSTISTESSGLYISASRAYKGIGGLKLGTGSYAGSITTKELDLSGAFYIAIEAGQYGTDTGSIVVSIDGDTPVISENDFSDVLYANIAAGTYTNKSKVTIATSAKRGRVYSVAIKSGQLPSKPTFSVAKGTYNTAQSVEISCATDGATIHYTTDGSTPTSSSPTYSTPISVNASMTIKAIAIKDARESVIASATYTLKVATPTFSPVGGSYADAQSVTISCSTVGATIHYTTDGTNPTGSSPTYSTAISVSATQTIKAIAIKDGWTNSEVASAPYTIGGGGGSGSSYTIIFSTASNDNPTTAADTDTACSDIVSAGGTYLTGNLVTATRVYPNGTYGLKLGAASSKAGTIKMNLASSVTPTSIVVRAKRYNSSKAVTLSVNGETGQSITSSFDDYTFDITSSISYIQIDASQYCWIESITVNY